jgi:hypothetical protein
MDDRIVGVFLDDEPQRERDLVYEFGRSTWNGIPVKAELIQYEWQKEGEYFLFLYRDTNLLLIFN